METFPCFVGTIRCSDSLTSLPPRFVSFAWRYPACRGGFVSPNRSHGRTIRPGVFVAGGPFRLLRVETSGPPRFLGNPGVSMPRSSTPVGPADPADLGTLMRPSELTTSSAPTSTSLSGLYHAACPLAVYASQHGSPRDHARLASGGRPPWPGRIGYLPGSTVRFSFMTSRCTSLPRLRLAHRETLLVPGRGMTGEFCLSPRRQDRKGLEACRPLPPALGPSFFLGVLCVLARECILVAAGGRVGAFAYFPAKC